MSSKPIGTILEINRYPVKSLAGETLKNVNLELYGMYGDRSHAFVDDTKEGWSRYITARQFPDMLRYKAEIESELSNLEIPRVKINGPDGEIYSWDEHLPENMPIFSNRKVSMEQFSSASPTSDKLAVDEGSILIITEQSLKKLELLYGKGIDKRRFRANFWLGLFDNAEYDEADIIGKQLLIGNAKLTIKSLCKRCSMITIDPDTQERDPSLLKIIHENMNLNFGWYADVEQAGSVNIGDEVFLLN